MIPLNDKRWKEFKGGYGTIFDASIPLQKLEQTSDSLEAEEIYKELWEELHHQGALGLASYFAVPHLIRIAREKNRADSTVLGLITVIEVQRHKGNPQIPVEFLEPYLQSLREIPDLILKLKDSNWNYTSTTTALSALAASKGQLKLAEAILNFDDEDVLDEFLDTY